MSREMRLGTCEKCGRKTGGVLAKNPEDGTFSFLPSICSRCLLELSEEVDGEEKGDPKNSGLTCKKCKAKVWALRNSECIDCYLEACEAVDNLPEHVEPIPPPLGYGYLIGESEASAKTEIDFAYMNTPHYEDLEN